MLQEDDRFIAELLPGREGDPDRAFCKQRCPHCPSGDRTGLVRSSSFSQDSLDALQGLQAYVVGHGRRLDEFWIVGHEVKNPPTIHLDPFPKSYQFIFGKIDEPERVAQEVREFAQQVFASVPRQDRFSKIHYSTMCDRNKNLMISDLPHAVRIIRALFENFLDEMLPNIPVEAVSFGLGTNSASPKLFDQLTASGMLDHYLCMELKVLMDSIYPKRKDMETEILIHDEDTCMQAEIHRQIKMKRFVFSIITRLIRGPDSIDPLPDLVEARKYRNFRFHFQPRRIWVNHHTHTVDDPRVFMDYPEYFELLEKATREGHNLGELVYDKIVARFNRDTE